MELKRNFLFFLFIIAFAVNGYLFADTVNTQLLTKEITDANKTEEYWTPEKLRNAKPYPLQVNATSVHESPVPGPAIDIVSSDGKPPMIEIVGEGKLLYTPVKDDAERQVIKTLFNRGNVKENFSSSRLVPLTADNVYPYRAVGKLFFTIPGEGDFVCSGSVLRQRIVLTAGHCVHIGNGGDAGFFTNWLFIPAFRDGSAPFQSWHATFAATTETWATGTGMVPNAADYGMLEMEDKKVNGTVQKIGTVTGFLGYQTGSLIHNHAHLLGYPCNLDRCQKMHQVTAQSARPISPNNVEYGSDMGGGSSGGPWVQNFGVASDGQTRGINTGINRVVGVTSFGYTDSNALAEGASIFDNRFVTLLNKVCAHKGGNCS